MAKKNYYRKDKPHPIDFKEFKAPLREIADEQDRSIAYLVRQAVKFWVENKFPHKVINK